MSFDQPFVVYAAAAFFGYVLGSVPFGLVFTRLSGKGDVRNIGSGNIGATNVLRTGSRTLAAATLLCDALKGLIPALAAKRWGLDVGVAAGFFALAGHILPVWLGFGGGKGVATYIGVLAGLHWPLAAAFCALWLLVAAVFRLSSLAALAASALTPAVAFVSGMSSMAAPVAVMAAVIFWKHRENIRRLLRGEESRIELRKG